MTRWGSCAGIAALVMWFGGVAGAQEPTEPTDASASPPSAEVPDNADLLDEADLLSDEELDALVAPIALYPDALLAQILMAATYPLDIVKADRFIDANAALDDKGRATAAEGEDWDPSVQVLTGGFPDLVGRMADEVDWTEELGDAVLAQSDDVFDAVQRQRARAAAIGNLTSNAAQTVSEEDGKITVAPAEPDKVYVPEYDAASAYTTPYTAPPVVAGANTGYSTTSLVTTGAIAFGSALLIDELFDDDDDWDDYWRPGPPRIDWEDGDFHPRPNVDIGGDVVINRRPGGDRIRIDHDRIGDGHRDGAWRPSKADRDAAKKRIAARRGGAESAAARDRLHAPHDLSGARAKLEAASGRKDRPGKPGAGKHKEGGAKKAGSVFSGAGHDGPKAAKATDRGKKSLGAKPKKAQAKHIAKPKKPKLPVAKPAKKGSAFQNSGRGGAKAHAAAQRGKKHGGRRH